jgi:flagellar biosynthesis protein FliR
MTGLSAELLWKLMTPDDVWGLALASCRVFGCLQFGPITSEPSIPFRVRLMLAVVLGCVLTFLAPFDVSGVSHPLPMALVLEFAIGATIGLGATLILMGLRGAADLIDQQSGMAVARVLDPHQNEEASPNAPLLWLAGIAVFVLLAPIGGDLQLVGHLLGTFQTLPIGSAGVATITDVLLSSLLGSLELAVGVAAPILITLSAMNWSLGLWQRANPAVPQSGWLLPVRLASLWLLLGWTAGMLPQSLERTFQDRGAVVLDATSSAWED